MTITDLYQNLFGKTSLQDGDVIEFAEHGRVGGVSTGAGFKNVQIIDANGNPAANLNSANFVNGTTAAITDTTTTAILPSAGAGLRNYITSLIVTNSHATVGTFVKITDGASTILWEGYAAAAGGGFAQSFPIPLKGTAATAVNAICVTTGANVIVSACGYAGA